MASGLKMFSLEGQTAFITGATRGIGQAAALGLAEAGADLILIQVNIPCHFLILARYLPSVNIERHIQHGNQDQG